MISITSTFLGRPTGLLFYYLNTYTNYSARTVAVTRISELNAITTPSGDDLFIINDGSVTTNKITYANILAKVTDDIESSPLVFTNSVELSSALILSGVISVTGDITFTGGIGGIDLGKLDDVDMSVPPTAGQNLVWDNVAFQWKPGTTVIPSGVVVDSINGQIGTVVLNADDIDDTATSHKFATAGQLGLADTALQPTDNISELTNDANYIANADNISLLTNDSNFIDATGAPVQTVNAQTGAVVLDADDIDDTSTTHKFATAQQLSDAESALQSGDTLQAADGTDAQPSLSFVNDPNTGLYSSAADTLSVTTNSAPTAHFTEDTGVGTLEMVGDGGSVILSSPDGTRYRLTVDNAGALVITAVV